MEAKVNIDDLLNELETIRSRFDGQMEVQVCVGYWDGKHHFAEPILRSWHDGEADKFIGIFKPD